VHRKAETTFDISADLQELAHTNVTVICAGAKAILDLPLTLQYLETFGVPVLGYQSENLAAFYSRDSGLKLDVRVESAEEIAKIVKAKRDFGLDGGILISNPIPIEYAMESTEINRAIDEALIEMENSDIKGKNVTPFLLAKIKDVTEGKSLASNIELVKNNARIGAQVAFEICRLKGEHHV